MVSGLPTSRRPSGSAQREGCVRSKIVPGKKTTPRGPRTNLGPVGWLRFLEVLHAGINDAGLIVGTRQELSSEHGFLYNAGTITDIDFPGFDTTANAINSSGVIVGTIYDRQGGAHGYVLLGGVFTQIDFPLAMLTDVLGINDGGELAGSFRDTHGEDHGFVYSRGVFNQIDVFGAKGTYLTRIKNGGHITGYFLDLLGEAHGMVGR